jgi:hypothetical protein
MKDAVLTLNNLSIKCTDPSDTNDPYDCSPFVHYNGNPDASKIRQIQKHFANLFSLLCFSTRNDSIPMWSYYADSHKGLTIGFDSEDYPFNSIDKQFKRNFEYLTNQK